MLPFLRADLAQLTAYTPHPGTTDSAAAHPKHLDPLDTNECPYDLPEDLKAKLAWQYQQVIAANRYPDGSHQALKSAIADYVIESGQLAADAITPHHISVGNGSDELIRSLLIVTCTGGAGSILVANPTFSMYAILAQTLGISVVSVGRSETTFEVDWAAAQAALTPADQPPVRVVFMVHPNSPTGNVLTPEELAWLKALPEHILVVIDEAYFEFSQHTTVAEVLSRPNWVVTRTFSKAFRLAAHRVGYAIAHPALIAALEKVRLPYNLPSFSQAAAQLALRERSTLLSVVPELLAERQRLYTALSQSPDWYVWPSRANFLYARPRNATQLEARFNQLKAQGTLVRLTGGGLRITIGTPEENQRTLKHLLEG